MLVTVVFSSSLSPIVTMSVVRAVVRWRIACLGVQEQKEHDTPADTYE